ncbi:hypothetical protein V8B97DRAFT_1873751 [Scleroderma yunnanense]
MLLRALVYAYVLGGLTFIPLVIAVLIFITIYTSVPVQEQPNDAKAAHLQSDLPNPDSSSEGEDHKDDTETPLDISDFPKTRKSWLTVRRTFEESESDGSYMNLVKSYLDARSKDPKRSRPKDMWYVVLKGKVLYLYEDESMTECEAVIELGGHEVTVYPEGLADGELFTRRNAICLRARPQVRVRSLSSGTKQSGAEGGNATAHEKASEEGGDGTKKRRSKERDEGSRDSARASPPWFIFVRSCVEMEDWYLALVHASDHPAGTPMLNPLQAVFSPSEMNHLVATLDQQPDVIPMRWLNAIIGRVFFSFYRTRALESAIIGRLMKKLSKVKRPAFLTEFAVTRFSIGDKVPTLSKPMLKELTKEGDASLEVGLFYKGEIRATVEATAVINLGARFKSYTVKLVLAVVLRELEGNLLIKVKRPPSSRLWYAFTKSPRMVLNVEPIVSDRQITWSMILNTIESKLEEIIADSVVMPNMDDISFWDSTPYTRRGGLWSDAARAEKPVTSLTEEERTPVSGACGVSEEKDSIITPPPIQPADSLVTEASPPSDVFSTERPEPSTTSSDASPRPARRQSGFGVGEDSDHESTTVGEDTGSSRGRRCRSESTVQRCEGSITPSAITVVPASDLLDDEQDASKYLSPQYSPRSSSAHSQARSSRTHSVSSSTGDECNTHSDLSAPSSSRSPRHSFGAVSTTSSFLSTLKSKATDKQALSNTARETIRKWGVNWTTLRKDIGRTGTQEEMPDAGPTYQRARAESIHNRPSYADVRAAVTARREQSNQPETECNGSSPISIPQTGSSRPSGNNGSSSAGSSLGENYDGPSLLSKTSGKSLSRSVGDKTGDPLYDRDFRDDLDDHPGPSPIHTQPSQARTMTIPGIHASHRGEIMSMGNIAASPPSPENKLKTTTTIQSMYRLWKSPTLSGQPQGAGTQANSNAEGKNEDVTPLILSSEPVTLPSKPVPPPLPPRTISAVAMVRPTPGEIRDPMDERLVLAGSSKDEHVVEPTITSGTQEVRSPENKPPLPPRRIPT